MSLHDAVAKYVENGDVLATGGFTTNRKPYAAVSEILRQGQKDFIVYAGPGGGEVDMLIGEGRVAAYINCYTANSGYTNVSRRFRAAIEKGQLTYEDYSQDVLMLMLHASSLGLPFLPVRLMQGSGLMKYWGISEEKRKTMPKMEDLKCVEIENPMVPGQKVVVVEDLISTGGSVLEVVNVLREAGAEVLGIASIFTYGMRKSVERLAAANVKNVSLSDLDTVVEVAAAEHYIAEADKARLLQFRDCPQDESWIGGNK